MQPLYCCVPVCTPYFTHDIHSDNDGVGDDDGDVCDSDIMVLLVIMMVVVMRLMKMLTMILLLLLLLVLAAHCFGS